MDPTLRLARVIQLKLRLIKEELLSLQDSLNNVTTAVTDIANEVDSGITEIRNLVQRIRDSAGDQAAVDAAAAQLDQLAAQLEGKVTDLGAAISDANGPATTAAPADAAATGDASDQPAQ
jgi:predicted  nucleic acid-binding Zn-ribbon protein